jgi:flavin reductase (DIM6/NTAB) family NADH-FMN oxidoreductase RutF
MLFDFETLDPTNRYKLLLSTVVPRPIAWVVTQDAAGRRNAAPFSFFNVVSGDPAVVAIGVGEREPGEAKDTARNIRETGEFVVNLVPDRLAQAMNVTAIDFPPGVDELAEAGLAVTASTKVAPPRIAASPVALECVRMTMIETVPGRHIVLGRVVALHVADDCVLDAARCHVDTPKLDLIGRMHGGGWYTRTRDAFEMPRLQAAEWVRKG